MRASHILTITLAATPSAVAAQDIGAHFTRILGTFGGIVVAVLGFMLLVGITLIGVGLYKFKSHSENPNDPSSSIKVAVLLIFTGGLMSAPLTLMTLGGDSIYGHERGAGESAEMQRIRINDL